MTGPREPALLTHNPPTLIDLDPVLDHPTAVHRPYTPPATRWTRAAVAVAGAVLAAAAGIWWAGGISSSVSPGGVQIAAQTPVLPLPAVTTTSRRVAELPRQTTRTTVTARRTTVTTTKPPVTTSTSSSTTETSRGQR